MKKLCIVAALLLACPSDTWAQQASPSPFGGTTDRSIDTTKSLSAMEAPRIPDLPAPNLGWTDNPAVHQPARKFTFGVQYKYMAPELMLVGGHTLLDSVFSKFTALPYGAGDNGGCVFSVLMSFAPLTGTNCGAGAYEAVADYTLAINNPPWYVAGADFRDENGVSHEVSFTSREAILRPALPASYRAFMHGGAHVITNMAAGPVFRDGWPAFDGVEAHRGLSNPLYAQDLIGWHEGSDKNGSFTVLTMRGQWQPFLSRLANGATAVDPGHAPAIGSNNIAMRPDSRDRLDTTYWPGYTHPFIEIGIYVKHFTRNTTCSVQITKDRSDPKNLSPSRSCDEELDNWYSGPDYEATMHGLTIGSGFTNKVSTDSYGLAIASQWPTGIRVNLVSSSMDFDGDAFKVVPKLGPSPIIGARQEVFEFNEEPFRDAGWTSQFKMWQQVDSNGYGDARHLQNQHDTSWWLGPRYGDSFYRMSDAGRTGGSIVFNPGWAKNGVSLCGDPDTPPARSVADKSATCFVLSDQGNASLRGTLLVGGGAYAKTEILLAAGKLLFVGRNPSQVVEIFQGDQRQLMIDARKLAVGGDLTARHYHEALSTPASGNAPCSAGDFTDDENYHYVCVAKDRWKRVRLEAF